MQNKDSTLNGTLRVSAPRCPSNLSLWTAVAKWRLVAPPSAGFFINRSAALCQESLPGLDVQYPFHKNSKPPSPGFAVSVPTFLFVGRARSHALILADGIGQCRPDLFRELQFLLYVFKYFIPTGMVFYIWYSEVFTYVVLLLIISDSCFMMTYFSMCSVIKWLIYSDQWGFL